MPPNTPTTLVTGATGTIGRTLTRSLVEAGVPFRVMCRRPEQVDEFTANGIEAVRGDLTDPAGVRAALSGCEQLFLLPPAGPGMGEQAIGAIDAAREAGVHHVVKVSASDAAPGSPVPWAADHARADAHLRASGLAWTVLSPACFMSNLLPVAPLVRRGVLPGTSGRGATPWIDDRDVAAAAARVLRDPETRGGTGRDGREYRLTGTPPLSFPDVAAALTAELGHRVRYVHLPGPVLLLGLRAAGSSSWAARGLVAQFAAVVRHGLDGVRTTSGDLGDLLGRAPTDLAAYVRDHRHAFA
ncbi:NAD(P)H-binding protein [Kineococcus sp. R8]|uniref:NAD(P)H-binding protein n=1 Tax=Kineococcus siccus TaxID=2696567 RepID=UPI001412F3AC|nr:NAD(P)H-binding protein [Kineococcus siccus]NAZ81719.1 NAD(P)H-binding protein [Kineococcus siccus]